MSSSTCACRSLPCNSNGILKKTVGKSALAVVNMGYDTKIADILPILAAKIKLDFFPFTLYI